MRKADRSMIPEPASLVDANGAGARERVRAVEYYAAIEREKAARQGDPANKAKKGGKKEPVTSFNFNAYKGEDVKAALEKLFHEKCAYCESKYKAVMPVHVEHYRPKSRVFEDASHAGYWWLASEWTNLLPSCAHCNGNNYHEIHLVPDEEPYSQASKGNAYLLGKLDYFPVGAARAYNSDYSLDEEMPQILDPTRTNPSDHLEWIFRDDLSLVSAKRINGVFDSLGYTTYRLLGLNRQKLVEQRTELMLAVAVKMQDIQDDLQLATETSDARVRARIIKRANRDIDRMLHLADPNQPYSMMVRSLIDSRIEEIEGLIAGCQMDADTN